MSGGVRFAPSPTGVFHVGNLRTAWVSHWWARKLGLPWVVRFEDIDAPRVVLGARESQLHDMELLGLRPDHVDIQSALCERHLSLFKAAAEEGIVYPCSCSRKDLREAVERSASAAHLDEAACVYNGRCRGVSFSDVIASAREKKLPSLAWRFRNGDFIVGRTAVGASFECFVPSYHWACAIDDLDGRYDLLVRAWDLESAVTCQRAVQSWFGGSGFSFPAVFHTSLVTAADGSRLEKRTKGVTLAELLARGVSAERVLEFFRDGFDASMFSEFAPGKVFGELRVSVPVCWEKPTGI